MLLCAQRPAAQACSRSQSRRDSSTAAQSAAGARPCSGREPSACKSALRAHWRSARPRTAWAASASAVSSSVEEAAAAALDGFCVSLPVPLGRLSIRLVAPEDVGPASVLLTRAFATSAQGVPLQDGRAYVDACLRQAPLGVLLVARLHPDDASLLPPGQASRVVATTGLSFARPTREDFPTLQPPDDAAYLSNMAVDPKLRRQGLARAMLAAAEPLAAAAGHPALYLHARLGDEPALRLYLSSGYREVQRDQPLLARLRGITPRALLVKELKPAGEYDLGGCALTDLPA